MALPGNDVALRHRSLLRNGIPGSKTHIPSFKHGVPFEMEHEVQTMRSNLFIMKDFLIYAFSKGPIIMDGTGIILCTKSANP